MARIVIAGSADCPYYAKVELLADNLVKNLPDFKLHKIVIQSAEWESWLEDTCEQRGWHHHRSPIVWRELVDRGGKGMLIGSANEFQEYVHGYYGDVSRFTSHDMTKIAQENTQTKNEVDEELRQFKALSKPIHVCLTNAHSAVAYSMVSPICKGEAFGEDTEIALHLLTTTDQLGVVEGVAMEAFDLSCSLLRQTHVTDDPVEALRDASVVIITDEIIRPKDDDGEYEETEQAWLKHNADVFTSYAHHIDSVARKGVRVVVANDYGPLNFNATVLATQSKTISKQNIVGVSRSAERRAKAVLADRLSINAGHIVDVLIWGSCNGTHLIDTTNARIHRYDSAIWGPSWYSRKITEMVHDDKWLETEYLTLCAERKKTVESAIGHSLAMSLGSAVVTTLDHWWNGSPPGQVFSLAVCAPDCYELPDDVFFSLPVTMGPPGYWSVVQDIELTDDKKEKIKTMIQELQTQIDLVYKPPPPTPTPTPSVKSATSSARSASQASKNSSTGENGAEDGGSEMGEEEEAGDENMETSSQQDNESQGSNKKVFGEAVEEEEMVKSEEKPED